MDANLKRKFPGRDHLPATAPQCKRVSVSTSKRSGSVIGMDCASQELASLSKDLGEALKNPHFADVILRVGTDEFPAHKIILQSRSKVFERMLASNMKESKENSVEVVDVKASTVKAMLQYMYTGKMDEMFIDQVIDLYAAADRYGLLGLKEHCKNFIVKEIDEESFCDVAVLGDLHCDEELSKAVECMLKKNPKRIFESQKWRGFSEEFPVLYSKLVESLVLDQMAEIEQNNRKRTEESLLEIRNASFPRIRDPGIPRPLSPPLIRLSSTSSRQPLDHRISENRRTVSLDPPILFPSPPPFPHGPIFVRGPRSPPFPHDLWSPSFVLGPRSPSLPSTPSPPPS